MFDVNLVQGNALFPRIDPADVFEKPQTNVALIQTLFAQVDECRVVRGEFQTAASAPPQRGKVGMREESAATVKWADQLASAIGLLTGIVYALLTCPNCKNVVMEELAPEGPRVLWIAGMEVPTIGATLFLVLLHGDGAVLDRESVKQRLDCNLFCPKCREAFSGEFSRILEVA